MIVRGVSDPDLGIGRSGGESRDRARFSREAHLVAAESRPDQAELIVEVFNVGSNVGIGAGQESIGFRLRRARKLADL